MQSNFLIRSMENISQVIDFRGLGMDGTSPTNIDSFLEYKNRCFCLVEAKYQTAEPPYGQLLALERMCDSLQKDKPTLLIIASHSTGIGSSVELAKATVIKYRYAGTWYFDGKTKVADMQRSFCIWVTRYKTSINNLYLGQIYPQRKETC